MEVTLAGHKWQFKTRFRANAYGWHGSKLAIGRLKEAVSEIKKVSKSGAVEAGEGVVLLMEAIWPAFQGIDTSSGALGTAVAWTLDQLIPILINAPADHGTMANWLERLFAAVQDDGVEYLGPVEDRWGEIARYPDLINDYADRLLPLVARAWADHRTFSHVTGTTICLSCLLNAGRHTELFELLAKPRLKFWPYHRFGAEALVRQGLGEAAIAYAEAARATPPTPITTLRRLIVLARQFRSVMAVRRKPTAAMACAPPPAPPILPSTGRWFAPIPPATAVKSSWT